MVTILPTVMPKSMEDFNQHFTRVMGFTPKIQIDIIDGVFAQNKTLTPEEFAEINTIVEFEAHLMVDDPVKWIPRCIKGGFSSVIGQVERMPDKAAFIADAQVAGLQAGLALSLETPTNVLKEFVEDLDSVLLLSVQAGQTGAKFDNRVIKKIEEVRAMREGLMICVDGGLDVSEIKECIAGEWAAEIRNDELHRDFLDIEFAVGAHIWDADNPQEKLNKLRRLEQ